MKINKTHINLLLPILMNTRTSLCEIHIKNNHSTSILLSNGESGTITKDDFGNYHGSLCNQHLSTQKNGFLEELLFINHIPIGISENAFGTTVITFDNQKIIYQMDCFGHLQAQMGELKCTSRENDFGTIYLDIFKSISKNQETY